MAPNEVGPVQAAGAVLLLLAAAVPCWASICVDAALRLIQPVAAAPVDCCRRWGRVGLHAARGRGAGWVVPGCDWRSRVGCRETSASSLSSAWVGRAARAVMMSARARSSFQGGELAADL